MTGLETLPGALKERERAVPITGGDGSQHVIMVRRWNLVRLATITKYVMAALSEAVGIDLNGPIDKINVANMKLSLFKLLETMPEKIPGLMQLIVSDQDRPIIDSLFADDALAVLNASIELNSTPELKKEARRLMENTKGLVRTAPNSTQ